MEIQPIDILKWIGIVLAAGFVGYFGRYLAMMIIARIRKKPDAPDTPPGAAAANPPDDVNLKLEKKRAKQAVKQAKKATKR